MSHRSEFKIQYGEIYSPSSTSGKKSFRIFKIQYGEIYSNGVTVTSATESDLKSSMERFIVRLICTITSGKYKFKIQYGEIYRLMLQFLLVHQQKFKIQYGEIYRNF